MPVVFRERGLTFYYYANEGSPLEPVHIHVTNKEDTAKFWVRPDTVLATSQGFDGRTLKKIRSIVEARADEIEEHWNDFFRKAGRL